MDICMLVPDGFGVTTAAYNKFIKDTGIDEKIDPLLEKAHEDISNLNRIKDISNQIKDIIESARYP